MMIAMLLDSNHQYTTSMNANFDIEFNETVENVKAIAREARHMNVAEYFTNELPKFTKFMDDVNFKMEFVDDPETYVMSKMLDAMDYILDNWIEVTKNCKSSNSYKVANSIYDCIKEFYFEN